MSTVKVITAVGSIFGDGDLTGRTITLNWIPGDKWLVCGDAGDELYILNLKTNEVLCVKNRVPPSFKLTDDPLVDPRAAGNRLNGQTKTESYREAMSNSGKLQKLAKKYRKY